MNKTRLYEILNDCSIQLRKGDVVHGTPALVEAIEQGSMKNIPGGVVTIDAMPHHDDALPEIIKIDVHFAVIGVQKEEAERHRDELVEILKQYPNPSRLAQGPSYIEVGGEIGDQGTALQLFGVGEVLGLWKVIIPATLGITGPGADMLAGSGFVMISGFDTTGERHKQKEQA